MVPSALCYMTLAQARRPRGPAGQTHAMASLLRMAARCHPLTYA